MILIFFKHHLLCALHILCCCSTHARISGVVFTIAQCCFEVTRLIWKVLRIPGKFVWNTKTRMEQCALKMIQAWIYFHIQSHVRVLSFWRPRFGTRLDWVYFHSQFIYYLHNYIMYNRTRGHNNLLMDIVHGFFGNMIHSQLSGLVMKVCSSAARFSFSLMVVSELAL